MSHRARGRDLEDVTASNHSFIITIYNKNTQVNKFDTEHRIKACIKKIVTTMEV